MPSSTGVYRKRNGYYPAKIVVDGEQLRLGDWPTEKQAARAYDSAARYYRVAEIKVDYEDTYLGHFEDEIESAKAYDRAALKLHDTANTNFPPSDYDVGKAEELP